MLKLKLKHEDMGNSIKLRISGSFSFTDTTGNNAKKRGNWSTMTNKTNLNNNNHI